MKFSVYVAGASSERNDRAIVVMSALRAAGIAITHDWTAEHDGGPDWRLTEDERLRHTVDDIRGIKDADLLVALVPLEGVVSTGVWVELGVGIALLKPIFISGWYQRTIFTERTTSKFASDGELVAAVIELATMYPDARK
jgi:nucleoside 2-deoxyribosyltransferase